MELDKSLYFYTQHGHELRFCPLSLWDAYMDVGSRAPTVGALGDAGAVAERAGVRAFKQVQVVTVRRAIAEIRHLLHRIKCGE
jgi:hypothetical protein